MRWSVLLVITLLFLGCKQQEIAVSASGTANQKEVIPQTFDPKAIVLSITTTPCFGQCPVYELIVYGNQSITFNGKQFAHLDGFHNGQMNQYQFKELLRRMNEAKLIEAESVYDNPNITDLPTTYIEFSTENGMRKITARYGLPEPLSKFIKSMYTFSTHVKWEVKETTTEEE